MEEFEMKEGYGEFIRRHRITSGYKSQRRLAEKTGISSATISRIESEIQVPEVRTLQTLSEFLETTSFVELMVVCGYWNEDELLEPIDRAKQVNGKELVSEYNKVKEQKAYYNANLTESEHIRVPILGSIAAGIPIDRIENIEGFELVEKSVARNRSTYALVIKGDSMIGDGLKSGDLVIVVQQPEVTSADIAVVAINGHEATLKRVKCNGDMCMLIPSNPTMEPIMVPAKDVHILGKVIQARRNFE